MTPGVLGNAAVLRLGEEPPIERDVMTGRSELRLNLYLVYCFVKRRAAFREDLHLRSPTDGRAVSRSLSGCDRGRQWAA